MDHIKDALSQLSALVHQNACDKGFHDDDHKRSDVENYAIWTANLHGEVSELWEAARSGASAFNCDKYPQMQLLGIPTLSCEEEELADILIRVLDTAKARNIDIGRAVITKHLYNTTRPHRHGDKLV